MFSLPPLTEASGGRRYGGKMPELGSEHVERRPHLPLTVCVIWDKIPEIAESQIPPLNTIKVCVVSKDQKR